jgi:hypothetical protein
MMAVPPVSTPMRRIRSSCRALPASGHLARTLPNRDSVAVTRLLARSGGMGRLNRDPGLGTAIQAKMATRRIRYEIEPDLNMRKNVVRSLRACG